MNESSLQIDEARVVALATQLGRTLEALGGLVVTAESCTGGLIARALTETAGSSAWFDRGLVTYSNAAKQALLGVNETSLERQGAVSELVAREMAEGALRMLPLGRPRLAASVTGIAGPGGAVPGKPVGTVCFGWAVQMGVLNSESAMSEAVSQGLVVTATQIFDGDRAAVRRQAAAFALDHAMSLLQRSLAASPPSA